MDGQADDRKTALCTKVMHCAVKSVRRWAQTPASSQCTYPSASVSNPLDEVLDGVSIDDICKEHCPTTVDEADRKSVADEQQIYDDDTTACCASTQHSTQNYTQ